MNPFIESNLETGEIYAGLVLGKKGEKNYHLFLRPEKPETKLPWDKAIAWAKSIGYDIPTRQEQFLLIANCQLEFKKSWYWTSEEDVLNPEFALAQNFHSGEQMDYPKLRPHRVCAVRKLYEAG